MKISLELLKSMKFSLQSLGWFEQRYGDKEIEFNQFIDDSKNYIWLDFMMRKFPELQTEENFKIYLDLNKTDYESFGCMIIHNKAFQTEEAFQKYLEMNKDDSLDFSALISIVPAYKTNEKFKILSEMPYATYDDLKMIIKREAEFQTKENYEILESKEKENEN